MTIRWRLLLLALLIGPGSSASVTAARTLTIGISQFPDTIFPTEMSSVAGSFILRMALRPITHFDAAWRPACLVCDSYPTLDNDQAELELTPDGRPGIALRYRIREGLSWGDGTPVSSADVIFAWRVGGHPASRTPNQNFYRPIYRIDDIDGRSFVVHLDRREYDFANRLFYAMPAHLEQASFEASPEQFGKRTRYKTEPTHPGLYWGPYLIKDFRHGVSVVLEPNPHWQGQGPHFERIVVRAIQNTAALEANLLSGHIDMIAGELGLRLDQAIAFERRHRGKYQVLYQQGLLYEHIDLNLDNPVLADRRVRQALLFALDRETINQRLFQGRQPVAHSFVHPLDLGATTDLPQYAFDAQRAAGLLDEAGWPRQGNGLRRNADGDALRLEIMTTAGDKTRELVQQVLQNQWRQAGIDVRIRNQTARIFFGETTRKRRYSAMAMYAWSNVPEASPESVLSSEFIPSAANNYSGQNSMGWRSAEADRLIAAVKAELDPAVRRARWQELQVLYMTELPVLPLFFRTNPYILPHWLQGVKPTGHLAPTTDAVEYWTARD